MMSLVAIVFAFGLGACVSAEQKPSSNWQVKTTTASQQTVWVAKGDGSKQCGPKTGITTPGMAAAEAKQAGIIVHKAKAGNDGRMRSQQCGQPTGATVELEISRNDLRKALSLGFVSKETASQ